MARTLERRRTRVSSTMGGAALEAGRTKRDDAIVLGLLWLTGLVQLLAGLGGDSSYIALCGAALMVEATALSLGRAIKRRLARRT